MQSVSSRGDTCCFLEHLCCTGRRVVECLGRWFSKSRLRTHSLSAACEHWEFQLPCSPQTRGLRNPASVFQRARRGPAPAWAGGPRRHGGRRSACAWKRWSHKVPKSADGSLSAPRLLDVKGSPRAPLGWPPPACGPVSPHGICPSAVEHRRENGPQPVRPLTAREGGGLQGSDTFRPRSLPTSHPF